MNEKIGEKERTEDSLKQKIFQQEQSLSQTRREAGSRIAELESQAQILRAELDRREAVKKKMDAEIASILKNADVTKFSSFFKAIVISFGTIQVFINHLPCSKRNQ